MKIESNIDGLSVTVSEEGLWLHFDAGNGSKHGINLDKYAEASELSTSLKKWIKSTKSKFDLIKQREDAQSALILEVEQSADHGGCPYAIEEANDNFVKARIAVARATS